MPIRNRKTLKGFFKAGSLPTEDHFADLIDSTFNILSDGDRRDATEEAQVVSPRSETGNLIRFSQEPEKEAEERTAWDLAFRAGSADALLFRIASKTEPEPKDEKHEPSSVLTLTANHKVGVNTLNPLYTLDVAGPVRASGRLGVCPLQTPAWADGKWHNITQALTGNQAFEVVACVQDPNGESSAMVRATALYVPGLLNHLEDEEEHHDDTGFLSRWLLRLKIWFGGSEQDKRTGQEARNNPGLHCLHSGLKHRLELRWNPVRGLNSGQRVVLQIRLNPALREEAMIHYHLTQLWFESKVASAAVAPKSDEGIHV